MISSTGCILPEAGGFAGGTARGVLDVGGGGGRDEGCLWRLCGSILWRTDSLALQFAIVQRGAKVGAPGSVNTS